MATTEVTLNGNGTTGPYSYSGVFSAIKPEDIKVSINNVTKTYTTDYTVNFTGSTITFVTETPSSSDSIRIYRVTDADNPAAVFSSGSALRAVDLNDNFLQTLYVSQEVVRDVGGAAIDVNTAVQAAASAQTAASNAETAANNAVSVANTANTTANTANTTANTANTTADTANNTANTALNNATAAVTAASNAVTTANTAVTTADGAVTTADAAAHDATVALNLVSAIVDFLIVANVAAIPSSPANDDGVEILDTTGIESFTPLTGVPVGFTGSADLRAKIRYDATGSTWEWISYTAVDPESRYVNSTNGVISTSLGIGTSTPNKPLHISTNDPAIQITDADAGINSSIALIGDDLYFSNDFASAGANPSVRFLNGGVQSLFIDFQGRVGLGGSVAPDEALHIGAGNLKLATTSRIYSNPGVRGSVQISSPNTAPNRYVTFGNNFYYDSDDTYKVANTIIGGALIQMSAGNGDYGTFSFIQKQDPEAGGAQREALTIDSNGNLGVGETSPNHLLQVKSTNNTAETIAAFGNASINPGLEITTDGNLEWGFNAVNSRNLTFSTNQQERARITSDGRLGIGTANPAQTLDVNGGAKIGAPTGPAYIEVGQGATESRFAYIDFVGDTTYTGYGLRLIRNNGGPNTTSELTHRGTGALVLKTEQAANIVFVTNNTERMRINSDGTTVFSNPVTLPAGSTVAGYRQAFNHITDNDSTSPNDHQWVSVLTPGTTITLPANPTDGMEIRISVGNFTNTVVAGNGAKIMNDTADLTIDVAYKTVTLIYDGLTVGPTPVFGWRII